MLLNEVESKKLLSQVRISVVATELATSKDEAVSISRRLGYPVVLKIASPDVVHKSDAGGVKLKLQTPEAVATAYDEIMLSVKSEYPQADILGVSVQKMARPGLEVIIGMSRDKQFGPVMMFGLGGIWVELLKDVSFRLTPLTRQDATDMINEIKAYPLLKGFRGSEPVDIPSLEETILRVVQLVEQRPQIQELDLNPIVAYSNGALVVDARIIIEEEA